MATTEKFNQFNRNLINSTVENYILDNRDVIKLMNLYITETSYLKQLNQQGNELVSDLRCRFLQSNGILQFPSYKFVAGRI